MTNEAAERLLQEIEEGWRAYESGATDGTPTIRPEELRAALAEERRATVERIRAAVESIDPGIYITSRDVRDRAMPAILDAEAR